MVVLLLLSSSLAAMLPQLGTSEPERESLRADSTLSVSAPKSGSIVDVPSWRIGDRWTYDGEFDVAQLIASGGVNAQVGMLSGTLNRQVEDIVTMTIENRSTLVYEVRSTGTFGANNVNLDGYSGDLSIDYESNDLIRVSDLANIRLSMSLDVDFSTFGGWINIDVAELTIQTTYDPPQESHDFPISVGESWSTSYTVTTTWSGSSDYFTIPEDSEDQGGGDWSVVAAGNPGVSYSGCGTSYNITNYDSDGNVTGFHWYCPAVGNDAWQQITQSLGLIIDFRLTGYQPVTRQRTISVALESTAWPLNIDLGAWINVSNAAGWPMAGQTIEFRYEADSEFQSVTTAANGSAHVVFDTGNATDPSAGMDDYASHGVIGWIGGTKEVGVSTLTLDENLLEVDLIARENGVTVTRTRGDQTLVLSPDIGYDAVPEDALSFNVPVVNRGIFESVATELEITAPDGSTSRATVPPLATFEEVSVVVDWTVPSSQPYGDVSIDFTVDPDHVEIRDGNRSNDAGSFSLYIGRLPSAALSAMQPFLTLTNVTLDATASVDPDGGDVYCLYTIDDEWGGNTTVESEDCTIGWSWVDDGIYTIHVAVTDDENDVDSTNMTVTVENRPPVVNVTSDSSEVPVMQSVTFDATDHDDPDTITPEAPISILWAADCAEGRVTLRCTVAPQVEGWFEIGLTITDDDGFQVDAVGGVVVTNIAPWNASIRAYVNDTLLERDSQMVWHVLEDQPILLVGSAEDSANDLEGLRHLWQPDLEVDPSDARWLEGEQTQLTISYAESGQHRVALDVYDDDEASSGVVDGWFEVANVAPWIEPFDELLPIGEDKVLEVTGVFNDTESDLSTLIPCWDLDPVVNADETGAADDDCDIKGALLSHSWPRAETAPTQIHFHVTDDDGERVSEPLNLTVRNVRPKAEANATSLEVEVGVPLRFSAEGTTDSSADMEVLTYRWDFDGHTDSDDDGFTANDIEAEGFSVNHTFENPGTYLVRLTVKDESAESTTDLQIIVIPKQSGFLGFMDAAGGDDPTIVIALAVVLLALLTALGVGMLRGEDADDAWPDALPGGFASSGSPTAAPPSHAFQTQTTSTSGPPLPASGLPEGWTMDQWAWYGEQWLADNPQAAAGAVASVMEPVGKSRADATLVTSAEPMLSPAPTLSDEEAAAVFDVGAFAAPIDPHPTVNPTTAANILQPVETASSAAPEESLTTAPSFDTSSTGSDEDPFAALDFDL